jgi:hypothetical protein
MELETFILCKISQPQRQILHVFAHMWNLDLNNNNNNNKTELLKKDGGGTSGRKEYYSGEY